MTALRAAIGRYAHTEPILSSALTSPDMTFDCADYAVISRAFRPMICARTG